MRRIFPRKFFYPSNIIFYLHHCTFISLWFQFSKSVPSLVPVPFRGLDLRSVSFCEIDTTAPSCHEARGYVFPPWMFGQDPKQRYAQLELQKLYVYNFRQLLGCLSTMSTCSFSCPWAAENLVAACKTGTSCSIWAPMEWLNSEIKTIFFTTHWSLKDGH